MIKDALLLMLKNHEIQLSLFDLVSLKHHITWYIQASFYS